MINQCKNQEGSVRKIEWVTQNVYSPRLCLTFSDETAVVDGPNPPQIAGSSILWDVKNGQSTTSIYEGLCQIRHILDSQPSKYQPIKLEIHPEGWNMPFTSEVMKSESRQPVVIRENTPSTKVESISSNAKLLLVDGSNLISRCHYAVAYGKTNDGFMQTSDGIFTSGVKGFMEKLRVLQSQYTHVAVCWDVRRTETFRRQLYAPYKATRKETPQEQLQQSATMKEVLSSLKTPQFLVHPFEADDIIGTFAKRWSDEIQKTCHVLSNDGDLHQTLSPYVSQIIKPQKKDEYIYTCSDFLSEYNLTDPLQWIDVKALLGETGDNYPGVPGVGDKAALPLIQCYGSIEEVFAQVDSLDPAFKGYVKKLKNGIEEGKLSKKLATIVTDIPELLKVSWNDLRFVIDEKGWQNECERLELKSLISVA